MALNTRPMLGYSVLIGFYVICGIFAEQNEYLDFIDATIDDYMDCINAGTGSFSTGERFESYADPVTEKLYEFIYTDKKRILSAKKLGKDMEIQKGLHFPSNLRNENRNNANVLLRYVEKVEKVRSQTTEEFTSHAGHGSVEAGVNLWIVEVSVKTTVEGEQTDKIIRESENTTTQEWDRIQVVPPFTNSNNVIKRFQKRMKVKTMVQRTVKGFLPIHVNKPGRDLSDPTVWQKCGPLPPKKLSDKTYIVSYENFADEDWELSDEGGLVQEYPEEGAEYAVDYVKFKRRLEAQPQSKKSIKRFCRLLNPARKIRPVVPDLDEEEGGIVEEDKSEDDEESPNHTKEHNIDLNEFAENLTEGKPEENRCKKKDKSKCGKIKPKGKGKDKKNKGKRKRQGKNKKRNQG